MGAAFSTAWITWGCPPNLSRWEASKLRDRGRKLLCASWKWQPVAADPEAASVRWQPSPQGTAGTCPAFAATLCLRRSRQAGGTAVPMAAGGIKTKMFFIADLCFKEKLKSAFY